MRRSSPLASVRARSSSPIPAVRRWRSFTNRISSPVRWKPCRASVPSRSFLARLKNSRSLAARLANCFSTSSRTISSQTRVAIMATLVYLHRPPLALRPKKSPDLTSTCSRRLEVTISRVPGVRRVPHLVGRRRPFAGRVSFFPAGTRRGLREAACGESGYDIEASVHGYRCGSGLGQASC